MKFTKVEGLGNHFILLDLLTDHTIKPKLNTKKINALCNPYFGIGGDGILLVQSVNKTDKTTSKSDKKVLYEMVVYNSDGSLAEMCGNGLRCVVHYLNQHYQFLTEEEPTKRILTGAGFLEVSQKTSSSSKHKLIGVLMGWPEIEEQIMIHHHEFCKYSYGNPHLVTFDEAHFKDKERLAPDWSLLVKGGINLSFAKLLDQTSIQLFVHERGCGWTQACGTGACATVFHGYKNGLFKIGQTITVYLPGGALEIEITPQGLLMWGPANEVFHGVCVLD